MRYVNVFTWLSKMYILIHVVSSLFPSVAKGKQFLSARRTNYAGVHCLMFSASHLTRVFQPLVMLQCCQRWTVNSVLPLQTYYFNSWQMVVKSTAANCWFRILKQQWTWMCLQVLCVDFLECSHGLLNFHVLQIFFLLYWEIIVTLLKGWPLAWKEEWCITKIMDAFSRGVCLVAFMP